MVPEDAYQSAPEIFVQDSRQRVCCEYPVDSQEAIEMKDLS